MQDRHTRVKRDIISIAARVLMHLFRCKLLRRLIHDHHQISHASFLLADVHQGCF